MHVLLQCGPVDLLSHIHSNCMTQKQWIPEWSFSNLGSRIPLSMWIRRLANCLVPSTSTFWSFLHWLALEVFRYVWNMLKFVWEFTVFYDCGVRCASSIAVRYKMFYRIFGFLYLKNNKLLCIRKDNDCSFLMLSLRDRDINSLNRVLITIVVLQKDTASGTLRHIISISKFAKRLG